MSDRCASCRVEFVSRDCPDCNAQDLSKAQVHPDDCENCAGAGTIRVCEYCGMRAENNEL